MCGGDKAAVECRVCALADCDWGCWRTSDAEEEEEEERVASAGKSTYVEFDAPVRGESVLWLCVGCEEGEGFTQRGDRGTEVDVSVERGIQGTGRLGRLF